jgi:hypothetical protein
MKTWLLCFILHPSSFILALSAVLDLFLVPVNLVLDSFHGQVDRRHQFFVLVVSDKVVLVLRVDQDFDLLENLIAEIDRDLDHADAVEDMEEFLGSLSDVLLVLVTQMPVPGA